MIKAAVVGAGWAGSKHLSVYHRIPDVEILAIADRDISRARSLAGKYHISGVYKDYQEMLEKEDIELLSLCTPTSTHIDVALKSVNHISYLLIEKPMALTSSECDEIIDSCHENNVPLGVCHNRLYFPDVINAKSEIEKLGIEDLIVVVSFELPGAKKDHWKAKQEEGGMLWEEGSHASYLFDEFIDGFSHIKAFGARTNYSVYDDIRAFIYGKNNSLGIMDISWVRGNNLKLEIYSLNNNPKTIDLGYREMIGTRTRNEVEYIKNTINQLPRVSLSLAKRFLKLSSPKKPKSYHYEMIQDFIASIKTQKQPPISGEEGKTAVRILEAVYESITQNMEIDY